MSRILPLAFTLLFLSTSISQELLTNKEIVQLHRIGLDTRIILAKINTSITQFDTSVSALSQLKETGIPTLVLEEMIYRNSYKDQGGVFFNDKEMLRKLEPSVFSGNEGMAVATVLSFGLVPSTTKSSILYPTSNNKASTAYPEFIFQFDRQAGGDLETGNAWWRSASSPNEFVLVRLRQKKDRRQLIIQRASIIGISTIVEANRKNIIPFTTKDLGDGKFIVTPDSELEAGEYCFFYQGTSAGQQVTSEFNFDFSVGSR